MGAAPGGGAWNCAGVGPKQWQKAAHCFKLWIKLYSKHNRVFLWNMDDFGYFVSPILSSYLRGDKGNDESYFLPKLQKICNDLRIGDLNTGSRVPFEYENLEYFIQYTLKNNIGRDDDQQLVKVRDDLQAMIDAWDAAHPEEIGPEGQEPSHREGPPADAPNYPGRWFRKKNDPSGKYYGRDELNKQGVPESDWIRCV